jgi:hypothetical protein
MAHFTTTAMLTISRARQNAAVSTVITTDNSWFAPGVGPARCQLCIDLQPDGTVEEPFSHSIAVKRGRGIVRTPPAQLRLFCSDIVKVKLTHRALV